MKKENKFLEFLNSKGFYTALFTCLFAVLAIAAFVSIRNIDAISKLTTYGEKDQAAVDDYLQPAAVQHDTPVSELSAGRQNNQSNRSNQNQQDEKTAPGSSPSGGVRKINETDSKPGAGSTSTPQSQAKPSGQEKAPGDGEKAEQKRETSQIEGEQSKADVQKSDTNDGNSAEAKPEAKEEIKTEEFKTEDKEETKQKATTAVTPFDEGDEMSWPLDGAIVMDFSVLHAIYDKTLEQYRTNPTVSISADVGTQVKAAADGTVKSISIDPRNGYTVILDHGNGWQTTYGQLQETILVKEGDTVKNGQAIGGVGTPTKYGVLLGSHLIFGVDKDDVPQNPKLVLASGEQGVEQ